MMEAAVSSHLIRFVLFPENEIMTCTHIYTKCYHRQPKVGSATQYMYLVQYHYVVDIISSDGTVEVACDKCIDECITVQP